MRWINNRGITGDVPTTGRLQRLPKALSAPAIIVLGFVPKMSQTLTFLATIKNDHRGMKTLAVISILALLTISGAVYTDLLLTSPQHMAQGEN